MALRIACLIAASRSGVPTAVDVIASLGEQGQLTYELVWEEYLGLAVVKSFFLHAINNDAHSGRCGFVYEVGEPTAQRGNHIHLLPDLRVMHSPGYATFFWIRLGPCRSTTASNETAQTSAATFLALLLRLLLITGLVVSLPATRRVFFLFPAQ